MIIDEKLTYLLKLPYVNGKSVVHIPIKSQAARQLLRTEQWSYIELGLGTYLIQPINEALTLEQLRNVEAS